MIRHAYVISFFLSSSTSLFQLNSISLIDITIDIDHDYYENQYNQMCRTSFNWLINVHMKKYAPFGIYKLRTMLRQV